MEFDLKTIGLWVAIWLVGYVLGLLEAAIKNKGKEKREKVEPAPVVGAATVDSVEIRDGAGAGAAGFGSVFTTGAGAGFVSVLTTGAGAGVATFVSVFTTGTGAGAAAGALGADKSSSAFAGGALGAIKSSSAFAGGALGAIKSSSALDMLSLLTPAIASLSSGSRSATV